jgi:predicted DNA-binding transcriptional regulator YafY
MNRTDRLLAIVLELQAKGRQRAEDLAATFETSKRTIYRDMLALGEAGVPLVSIPGLGYSLMEGYFLPPLSFSSEEATMLLLGSGMMAQSFDAQYRAAAQAAGRKIAGVLPDKLREEVHYLQKAIRFVSGNTSEENQEKLQQLRRAIIERTTIRFVYHTRHGNDGTTSAVQTREADPYELISVRQIWNLSAYCHLRKAMRVFRLDRIEKLELLPRTFQRIPGQLSCETRREKTDGDIRVRVLFAPEIARWVRENRSFYEVASQETPQGLLVTLYVRQLSDITGWLLSWGGHVRILEPDSLRALLCREVEAMARNYGAESGINAVLSEPRG